MRQTYSARAQRSGKWWALDIPEVPGVFSQVRRLDQAEAMARDALAAALDVDPDSFDVDLLPQLDPVAEAMMAGVRAAKELLVAAQRAMAEANRAAAVSLTRDEELTVRDAGMIMDLSYQRIAQLVEENDRLFKELGNDGGGTFGGPHYPAGDAPVNEERAR